MEALIWIATGALAGWSAGKLMKGRDYGWTGNIILGLIGSLVGGWIMHLLGGHEGGSGGSARSWPPSARWWCSARRVASGRSLDRHERCWAKSPPRAPISKRRFASSPNSSAAS